MEHTYANPILLPHIQSTQSTPHSRFASCFSCAQRETEQPARPRRRASAGDRHQRHNSDSDTHIVPILHPIMHHQLRTIVKLASSILLLSLISPPQMQHDHASSSNSAGLMSHSVLFAQAAVVPGRMLNSNHEEIFAQQAKELQKTKSKGRKPVGCVALR